MEDGEPRAFTSFYAYHSFALTIIDITYNIIYYDNTIGLALVWHLIWWKI